jgi:hypothetical protein
MNIVEYFHQITRCDDCVSFSTKLIMTDGKRWCHKQRTWRDCTDRCDDGLWLASGPVVNTLYVLDKLKFIQACADGWGDRIKILDITEWPKQKTNDYVEMRKP